MYGGHTGTTRMKVLTPYKRFYVIDLWRFFGSLHSLPGADIAEWDVAFLDCVLLLPPPAFTFGRSDNETSGVLSRKSCVGHPLPEH